MEQWGAKAITTESKTSPGDIIIIAESYPENLPVPLQKLTGGERFAFSSLPWWQLLAARPGLVSTATHSVPFPGRSIMFRLKPFAWRD